ncbi:uncharacterized protein At1g08160-like [Musa acuminata AAA Group]|uniref:uncharacterized protein At1g08160-like n=1 Tax=Musa acuminata AAA Group TaxID=214697 RepID=UPI0031D10683
MESRTNNQAKVELLIPSTLTPDNAAAALTTAAPSSQPATPPSRQGNMRCIAITAVGLIVLVGLVVLVFWLALRPMPLEYTIDDAHIRGFNITAHALNGVFDLRLRSYNRNTRFSVYYDAMEVTVWYGEQTVAISKVAPFYQPRHYVQTITVSATAQSTPLLRPVEKNLRHNESAGVVELEVRARARIRFAVGVVKKHYKLKSYCAPVVMHCSPSSHFDRVYCTSATLMSV